MKPEKGYIRVGKSKFFYTSIGKGEPIVFIPGWMAMPDSLPFKKILSEVNQDYLKKYKIIFLQLSNFYKSSYSDCSYDLDNYADELKKVLEVMKLEKVSLIGHSAGGRHVIHFTAKYPSMVHRLVLMNSAGLKSPRMTEERLDRARFYFAKFFASHKDVENILKPTFKNLYTSDLTEEIKEIKKRTLIIWGRKDTEMRVLKASKLNRLIKKSEVKIFEDLGHMTINEPEVYTEIFKFLKS